MENRYGKEELEKMIGQMESASSQFYYHATRIGNHAFIEFAGLMNEYIKLCQQTLQKDGDFAMASIHTGAGLVAHEYNIHYIAEKFECIFGMTLMDPKLRDVFLKGMNWKKETQHGQESGTGSTGQEAPIPL